MDSPSKRDTVWAQIKPNFAAESPTARFVRPPIPFMLLSFDSSLAASCPSLFL